MVHGHRVLIAAHGIGLLALALALIAGGVPPALAQGDIIYVDLDAPGPTHDGSTWEYAYIGLQTALADAEAGDQIWVAAGAYKPSVEHGGSGDRYRSFQMAIGVALYGGFDPDAGDDEWEERDWAANPTILSGDIGTEGDPADNAYHVFYHPAGASLDGTASLDGFAITGGNANGAAPHNQGGGMHNLSSSPTLSNCTFTGNSAGFGGGLHNRYSSPALTNVTFADNSAATTGGGIYNEDSAPTLTNCTFEGNSAVDAGGMSNNSSSPVLTNCVFLGNSADQGGGLHNYNSSPELADCTFAGNSADWGGGIYNYNGSSPTLTNCTFTGNSATSGGAGIFNWLNASPTVTNCILWGDTAGESPSEIVNHEETSTPDVSYSDIQGGCESGPWNDCGEGNIDFDPLFVDAASGDIHLGPGSPCIDAGTNTAPELPPYDFEGDPRILDGDGNGEPVVDMGVDEVWGPPPPVIFVDQEGIGTNSGTSWADAFTDLQHALAWAGEGTEIWVAAGAYKPSVEHGGSGDRYWSFQMANGVAIYGGFDPSAGDDTWEDRDWAANPTVLSGDIGIEGDPADNAYHVLYNPAGANLDGTAILDGFTITGGNANLEDVYAHQASGGGMHNDGCSPTLANLTFIGNAAWRDGGGLYNVNNSAPTLTNCTFAGNSSDTYGGGMANYQSSSPVLSNCTFVGNTTQQGGGGLYNGIWSHPVLTNCTFRDNSAGFGGGLYNHYSSPTLTNCTITGNEVWGDIGGGIFDSMDSVPVLTNCILWGDTSPELYSFDSSPDVTYSDIQGGWEGEGNIDADPLFVDPGSGDLHLSPGSPCIDTGSNAAPNLPAYDFEGDPRILDGDRDGTATVDMGVDEARIRVYLPLVLKGY